jgi:hypothetical protein
VITFPDTRLKTIHDNKYFSFEIIKVINEKFKAHLFGDYIYVIKGNSYINNEKVSKGDFLVITSNSEYAVNGEMRLALVRITQ